MTLQVDARFGNGVFVPEDKVSLPEHQRVTLVVKEEPAPRPAPTAKDRWWDDPDDPMADGGMALLDWWDRHRLQGLDPTVVQDLAESDEYLDAGWS